MKSIRKKVKIDKRKVHKWGERYINEDNIKIAILFVPLMILLLEQCLSGKFSLKDFSDVSILTSFLIMFICESVAKLLSNIINQKTEDAMKLNENYDSLVKKYSLEQDKMVYADGENGKVCIPAIVLCRRKINKNAPYDIEIEAVKKDGEIARYSLPKQVANKSEVLFKAHEHSVVYNNLNIRLNNLEQDGDKIKLTYCFTTYFDSLITNRAMDYPFRGEHTIREIYEPGPLISSLQKSKLSNHLGFNGFVELNDGNIVFVHRSNKVSIAKNTWSQSIGASLKTAFCLEDGQFTKAGLSNAISKEIQNELKLTVREEDFTKTIFAFYRDLLEGGKPQFLFYYKCDDCNTVQFEKNFREKMSEKNAKKENKDKQIVDGQQFTYFTVEELKKCKFSTNEMITDKGEKYSMVPSSIASVVMMLQSIG